MTTPKGVYRRRRKTTLSSIPRNIAEWFAGKRKFTFYAYTTPHTFHLKEYWETWKQEHPDAVVPEGLQVLLKISKRPPMSV